MVVTAKLDNEAQPSEKKTERILISSHQEGVRYLARVAKKLGAERIRIPKKDFEGFKPDLLITIGTQEKMVIDYVHTIESFPRDFTGMLTLIGEHRSKKVQYTIYRRYYLVLPDKPVYEQNKKRMWWLAHLPGETAFFPLPVSEFESYLRMEIEDTAKHTINRLAPGTNT